MSIDKPNNPAGLTPLHLNLPFTFAASPLSSITPDTFLHPLHPACSLHYLFTTFPAALNSWPQILKPKPFPPLLPVTSLFHLPLFHSHTHTHILSWRLAFIPVLSTSYLYFSAFSSTCSHCRSQCHLQTSSSAEILEIIDLICQSVHHHSKQGEAQCRSLMQSYLRPSHGSLTAVVLLSDISCISLTGFCVSPHSLIQKRRSSLPHKAALFDLFCTTPSVFSKLTWSL